MKGQKHPISAFPHTGSVMFLSLTSHRIRETKIASHFLFPSRPSHDGGCIVGRTHGSIFLFPSHSSHDGNHISGRDSHSHIFIPLHPSHDQVTSSHDEDHISGRIQLVVIVVGLQHPCGELATAFLFLTRQDAAQGDSVRGSV